MRDFAQLRGGLRYLTLGGSAVFGSPRVFPNHAMRPIGVFYATREGHTCRIAQHVAETLRARGFDVQVRNLRNQAETIALNNYSGVILAASVHSGKHEREIIEFVKSHRSELNSMPAAFLSVTLSEAGAERPNATEQEHAQSAADVQKVLKTFFAETGWHPIRTKPVSGALLYTKYNVLMRFIMKWIAKESGGDTDTSRDYEYTDWVALDRFVEEFAAEIPSEIAV
jgi:menaquinone-dependent protoporphyrinogen oxidase